MSIDMSGLIDPKIAAALWVLGFGLKHLEWKPIKELSNRLIPAILIILGIMMACVMRNSVSFDTILLGVVTSIFAVGVHASGKNIIYELLSNTTVTPTADGLSSSSIGADSGIGLNNDFMSDIDLADGVISDTNDTEMIGDIDKSSVG